MCKKVFSALGITLILALLASGVVFAAGTHTANRYGQVTAISNNQVTIQTLGGAKKIILITSNTKIYGVNGINWLQSSLKNRWASVYGTLDAQSNLVADTIILVPVRYSETAWNNAQDYGKITKVNTNANTFTISGQNGSVTYTVNPSTSYLSKNMNFSSLKKGMNATVNYAKQPDGTKLARSVIAFIPEK